VYSNAWVRLKRTGQVFTAYYSTDGVTWNLRGTQDPTQVGSSSAMPAAIFVGLCVTAHNNDAFGTADPLYWNTVEFADYNSNYVPLAPRAGLVATRSGGDLVISWAPTGGHLESSPVLGAAASWTTVGTANPATVPITGAAKFFRVVNP